MAKVTKPTAAKSKPAKMVKPSVTKGNKVEKKPVTGKVKVKEVKKNIPAPPAKKVGKKKPATSAKPVKKTVIPLPVKAASVKKTSLPAPEKPKAKPTPVKKVVTEKPVKPAPGKAEPASKARKETGSKTGVKPAAKKSTAKPESKPQVKINEPKPKISPKIKTLEPDETGEITIERKLVALYNLQQIDSQVDKIRIIRGELPLEVQDLEDEIAGLETRIENYQQENASLEKSIGEKKIAIKDSQALIKKYEDQQMNVRNNREYDSLTKEIEIQSLEIQLAEKRIREFQQALEAKTEEIERFAKVLADRKNDLEIKKNELDDIVAETEKEESELIRASEINHKYIEDRLITAYTRIRKNARNGLAVVQIERDACGGCFNKIPPQHQLDIRMHKKIIVCEYCGRILVDDGIVNLVR